MFKQWSANCNVFEDIRNPTCSVPVRRSRLPRLVFFPPQLRRLGPRRSRLISFVQITDRGAPSRCTLPSRRSSCRQCSARLTTPRGRPTGFAPSSPTVGRHLFTSFSDRSVNISPTSLRWVLPRTPPCRPVFSPYRPSTRTPSSKLSCDRPFTVVNMDLDHSSCVR